MVNRKYSKDYTPHNIDYDDKEVFKLISSGKTDGVFQLESAGMTSFMKELKPDSIDDPFRIILIYRDKERDIPLVFFPHWNSILP